LKNFCELCAFSRNGLDAGIGLRPLVYWPTPAQKVTAESSARRAGRSALEYSEVLKDELAAIKADVSRLLAE